MNMPVLPLVAGLGPSEILLILAVLVLLFGAKKLPELARGSGRALRIFKAETKGLIDDDDDTRTEAQRQVDARNQLEAERSTQVATPVEQVEPAEEHRAHDTDR